MFAFLTPILWRLREDGKMRNIEKGSGLVCDAKKDQVSSVCCQHEERQPSAVISTTAIGQNDTRLASPKVLPRHDEPTPNQSLAPPSTNIDAVDPTASRQ